MHACVRMHTCVRTCACVCVCVVERMWMSMRVWHNDSSSHATHADIRTKKIENLNNHATWLQHVEKKGEHLGPGALED